MARLWSSGAELQSVTAGMEFTTVTGSPSISTAIKRSGEASLRANPTAATAYIRQPFISSTSGVDRNFYVRVYVYITTATDALDTIISLRDSFAAATLCSIRMNSNRTLEFWNDSGAAQIGSDTAALNTGQWYRLEISGDWVSSSSVAVEAFLDGVSISSTTITLTGADNPDQLQFGAVTSTTCDLYFDDIAVNDATGSTQNGLPGAGSILHLYPNGDGDTSDPAGDYTDVDEKPTPDDNNTWAQITTDGHIYEVTIEDPPAIIDTIRLIQVGIRESALSAASESWVLRIKSASGGSVAESGTVTHNDVTWRTNGDTTFFGYQLTSYTDPTTSSAWTKTGTNSLSNAQIGIRAVDATPDILVSSLWALVEYIPSTFVTNTFTVDGIVLAQTTKTFTADGIVINTSQYVDIYSVAAGDGDIKYDNATWAGAHDATAGDTAATGAGFGPYVEASELAGFSLYRIVRSYIPFDTALALSGRTALYATLRILFSAGNNGDNDGQDYIGVVESTQASGTALVVGDFDQVGSTLLSNDVVELTGHTQSTTTFVINTAGIAVINANKATYVKFALREGHDIENAAPGTDIGNSIQWVARDYGNDSFTPMLRVYYSANLLTFTADGIVAAQTTKTFTADAYGVVNKGRVFDDFNDNSIDGKWITNEVVEQNQRAEIVLDGTSSVEGEFQLRPSEYRVDLTGDDFRFSLENLVLESSSTIQISLLNGSSYLRFNGTSAGNLTGNYKDGAGSDTQVFTTTYNATTHKWLRIRESGGTVYWDASEDGISWNNLGSVVGFTWINSLYFYIYRYRETGTPSTTYLDNLNLVITQKTFTVDGLVKGYASDLRDNFNDNSLDTSKWTDAGVGGSATVNEQNMQLEFDLPASATSSDYADITAVLPWILTENGIFVEVLEVPNPATNADAELIYFVDANNWLRWVIEAGTLYAQNMQGGVKTTPFSVAYNSATHRWWRIRESGGTIYWDTSVDGTNWTNRATDTTTVDLTAGKPRLSCYAYQNETNPGGATFDNFNLVPVTNTFTVDGIVLVVTTNTFTVDGIVLVITTNTFTVDGIVLVVTTSTFTADGIIVNRINRVVNPSAESDDLYWAVNGGSKARSTGESLFGGASLRFQATTADDRIYAQLSDGLSGWAVSSIFQFSVYLKGSGTVRLWAYDGSTDIYSSEITLSSSWTRYTLQVEAQATSGIIYGLRLPSSNTVDCYIDGALFERASSVLPYFDGDDVNGMWSGTDDDSVSYLLVSRNTQTFTADGIVLATTTNTFTADAVVPIYYLDQKQLSTGANFGFGEAAGAKYRGQKFTPTNTDELYAIAFNRDKGSHGIKVYLDTVSGGVPEHSEANALYSWVIPNASVIDEYGIYFLPIPQRLIGGTEYVFYLAPWNTATDAYVDDYRDVRGINTGGGTEVTYSGGWFTENLAFNYATFMFEETSLTFTVDGIVLVTTEATFTVDGVIVAGTQEFTFTVDGIVKEINEKTFTVDGIVFATNTNTFTVDGIVFATNTLTFTADGIIFATNTATFTADGIVLAVTEVSFTADGIVLETQTNTFTVDGIVLVQTTVSFTADGIIFATNTLTFTADGIVFATNTQTFTVDGIVLVINTLTFTADGIVLAQTDNTFTVDGIVLAQTDKTFTIDGIIFAVNTASFTVDGIIFATNSLTFTADGIVLVVTENTFTADGIVLEQFTNTFTIDGIVFATNTNDFTVDGIVFATNTNTFTIDGIVLAVTEATFTVDGVVLALTELTFTVDAIVLVITDKTFTVDGIIFATNTFDFTADGIVLALTEFTFTADGLINAAGQNTFTIDAIVLVITEATFTADGIVLETTVNTFTVDGVVLAQTEYTFTVDGIVFAVNTNTFTIDAIVLVQTTATFTIDGVVRETFSNTFTIDGIVLETMTATFTIDGIVFATNEVTFTIDGVVQVLNQYTFTADGIIFAESTQTFTIDAIVLEIKESSFTADGIISAQTTFTFTVDGIVKAATDVTFTVDGVVLETNSTTITVDAYVVATEHITFTADAVIFGFSLFSFNVDGEVIVVGGHLGRGKGGDRPSVYGEEEAKATYGREKKSNYDSGAGMGLYSGGDERRGGL